MQWNNALDILPSHTNEVIVKCMGYAPFIGKCIFNPICKCKIQNKNCCRVWVIYDSKYYPKLITGSITHWAEIPEYKK